MSQGLAAPALIAPRAHALRAALADWAAAEHGRFALWLPVFMTAGNACYFAWPSEPPRWIGGVAFAVSLAAAAALRRHGLWRAPALAAAALSLGVAAAQFATARAPPALEVPRHAVTVTGMVRAVEALPQGMRVTLEAAVLDAGAPQPRLLRIRLRDEDPLVPATGDTIRVRAMLRAPSPPAYPGGWDLQRDAWFSGIGAYGFALRRAEPVAHAAPSGAARSVQALRETIAARVAAVVPDSPGAICATLLTGYTAAIPDADRAAFRDSGLAHLLAIAGLHIGIVMGLFFGLSRTVLAASEWSALHLPGKAIAAVCALVAGGGYMVITGAHVPIMRSFSMACLVTLGVLLGRRALSLRGLALAMAALLLIAPEQAMGVSFQMSFSAVLALIAGYDALRPALRRLHGHGGWRRRLGSHVVALALTSALAGTASAPYAAYHFGHAQLYNVLANMAAVPITALWLMPAGLISLALMPLHLEAVALVPMGWGAQAVLWIGHAVSALPAATIAVPHMPLWGLAVVSLGIAWLGLWRTKLVRLAGVPAILFGLASPLFERPPDLLLSADGRLAGLRLGGTMFVQQADGFSGFTQDAWQQMWAADAVRALPDRPEPGLSCTPTLCTFRPRAGGATALLLLGYAPRSACGADVLASLEPIRLRCRDTDPWVVDRFSVWRDGAHAVWLDADGARVLSDRDVRGDRPWVPPEPD